MTTEAPMICVDEPLRSVTNYALEVAAIPALVCGTERFNVFRSHTVSFISQKLKAGDSLARPCWLIYPLFPAALPAAMLCVVEVCTLKVRITGPVCRSDESISLTLGYCSR